MRIFGETSAVLSRQIHSHLGVDDADGGFIPHVSLVPFCRRGVETQDCIVRVWKMEHPQVTETLHWELCKMQRFI